jgi:hypothetical protein
MLASCDTRLEGCSHARGVKTNDAIACVAAPVRISGREHHHPWQSRDVVVAVSPWPPEPIPRIFDGRRETANRGAANVENSRLRSMPRTSRGTEVSKDRRPAFYAYLSNAYAQSRLTALLVRSRVVKRPLAKARGFGACRTALRDSRRCQVGNGYSIPGSRVHLAPLFERPALPPRVTWGRAKPRPLAGSNPSDAARRNALRTCPSISRLDRIETTGTYRARKAQYKSRPTRVPSANW